VAVPLSPPPLIIKTMEKKLTIVIETFIDDNMAYRSEVNSYEEAEIELARQRNNFEKGQARQEEIKEA
jgi:hypothetical protein